MNDLVIALQPKQKEFLKSVQDFPNTFYGGAKGGGKSKGLRLIMLLRRFQYPGTQGALFRKTYAELEANHIRPLLTEFPSLRSYWLDGKKLLTLPNGSTLQFCHCENEKDVELYQGREFDDLGIEEVGQWTEGMFRKLQGSNRSSKPGIQPRTLLTGNPGGVGHKWLKRLFIERRYNEREDAGDYNFIQALVTDNAALIENDPAYVRRLQSEPNEALRKAYLYGSWDIFAGQFFSEVNREVHFIPAFTPPRHWPRFGAYDFGFNHPAAFGWFACNEDGDVFLYREFVKAQMRVDQFAEELNKHHDTKDLSPIVAGWDCWAKKSIIQSGTSPTVAEEFLKHDIILNRANIDRVQGASQLRNYLAWQNLSNKRGRPRFFIMDNCPITFDALSRMEHDPDRVEDVLKVDASEGDPLSGDDAYDMCRYALMSRPMLAQQEVIRHAFGTREWADQQAKRHEEMIDKQAQHEIASEKGEDFWNIAQLDNDEDPLKYYINKRRTR